MRLNFFLFFLLSTSCSGLMTNRSFIDEMSYDDTPFFTAGVDFPVVGGDSGKTWRNKTEWNKRIPLSIEERENLETQYLLKSELFQLEGLLSDSESEFYHSIKDRLFSSSEKIYFLKLSPSERRTYLQSKGLWKSEDNNLKNMVNSHQEELSVGMEKNQVLKMLGEPKDIELSGNPIFKAERWKYIYEGSTHFVYFSGGRVENWE